MATAAQALNQPLASPVVPSPKMPPPAPSMQPVIDQFKDASQKLNAASNAEAAGQARYDTANAAVQSSEAADIRGAYAKEQADLGSIDAQMQPFKPTQDTIKTMIPLFAMVGMLAAGIGGKRSSMAGQNAQAALTGMVQGWNKGQADVVAQQKTIYDENVKYLQDTAKRVKDAFADYKDNVIKFGNMGEQAEKLRQELAAAGADLPSLKLARVSAEGAEKVADDGLKIAKEVDAQNERAFKDYIASQDLEIKRQNAASGGAGGIYGPDEISYLIGLAKTGNMQEVNSLLGSSFGNTGKANRAAFLKAAVASDLPPQVLSQVQAQFAGELSGERALGTQSGRVEGAIGALQSTVPLALDASKKVDRSQFPKLTSIENAVRQGTGDTSIVQFNAYNQAVVNDYAQIMRRGGVSTDDASKRANDILSTSFSQGQYEVGLQTLDNEASAVKNGLKNAKDVIAGKDTKPVPTQADREYVKAHPDQKKNFVAHFGVNP